MKKDELKKKVGQTVRLQPAARDEDDRIVDDDWCVTALREDAIEIQNTRTGQRALLGFDHLYSYMSDPARSQETEPHGFLQLHVEVRLGRESVEVSPLLPPRAGGQPAITDASRFAPLVLRDGNQVRYFSWRGRGPVHLVEREEEAQQLMGFFKPLCEALRQETNMEPEFHLERDIRGEIVYELSSDGRARWRLRGGMGGAAGQHVLVLTVKAARR